MSLALQPLRTRAFRDHAAPVLKWAGGKKKLVPELIARMPDDVNRYFEPFLGGAALFLSLQPAGAVLSDINAELINLYTVIQDDVEALIVDLQRHRYEKEYFYATRATDPRGLTPVERASRTVFLNRTCFNGLYRVNRKGQFNVPFGRYTNPRICDEPRLRAVHDAMQGITIAHLPYAEAVESAKDGDFVYFDPPYDPITKTANFTAYTRHAFGPQQQRELRDTFKKLGERGVMCMLSNSDTPFIRELYGEFRIDTVMASRAISRSASGRKPVREVIVTNY